MRIKRLEQDSNSNADDEPIKAEGAPCDPGQEKGSKRLVKRLISAHQYRTIAHRGRRQGDDESWVAGHRGSHEDILHPREGPQ